MSRKSLIFDVTRVAEYSESYECGEGCCRDWHEPLADEAERLRAELERLWVIEDAASAFPAGYHEAMANLYAGCKHTETTGDPSYREDAVRAADAVLDGMRGK